MRLTSSANRLDYGDLNRRIGVLLVGDLSCTIQADFHVECIPLWSIVQKMVSSIIMTTRTTLGATLMVGELLSAVACGGATQDATSRFDGNGGGSNGGRSNGGTGGSAAQATRATGGISSSATATGGTLTVSAGGTNSSQTIAPGWLDANIAGASNCSAEELNGLERQLRQSLDSRVAQCISSEFWIAGAVVPEWESRTAWRPPDPGVVSMVAACDVTTGDLVDPFLLALKAALTKVVIPDCASSKVFTLHGLAEGEFSTLYQAAVQCGPRIDQVRVLLDDGGRVSEVRAITTSPNDPEPAAAADCLKSLIADARFPCLGGRTLCLLRVIDGG